MSNMTTTAKRYRLQVPAEDISVQEWIEAQINISTSIRQLIREDIMKNGYTDVTCRRVEQGPKRGRPTNAELERRAEENDSVEEVKPVATMTQAEKSQKTVTQNTNQRTSTASEVHTFVQDDTPKNPSMSALQDLLS